MPAVYRLAVLVGAFRYTGVPGVPNIPSIPGKPRILSIAGIPGIIPIAEQSQVQTSCWRRSCRLRWLELLLSRQMSASPGSRYLETDGTTSVGLGSTLLALEESHLQLARHYQE